MNIYDLFDNPLAEFNLPERKLEKLYRVLRAQGYSDFQRVEAPRSPFLLRAHKDGDYWFVKGICSHEPFKFGEMDALHHWQGSGRVPEVSAVTDDKRIIAIKDLHAPDVQRLIDEAGTSRYDFLPGIASTASRIHASATPQGELDFRDILEDRLPYSEAKHDTHLRWMKEVYAKVRTAPAGSHYVHGDLGFKNIICRNGEIWFIDPYGLQGYNSLDLTVPASNCPDPYKAMSIMEKHYTGTLEEVPLMLAWSCAVAYGAMTRQGLWSENHVKAIEAVL